MLVKETFARPSLRGPTRMLPQENPVARSRNWHFAPCQAAARHVREQLHWPHRGQCLGTD